MINDLVERLRLLEDKLIEKDDTLNEEDDVEISNKIVAILTKMILKRNLLNIN